MGLNPLCLGPNPLCPEEEEDYFLQEELLNPARPEPLLVWDMWDEEREWGGMA